jgi:hypothetical protein
MINTGLQDLQATQLTGQHTTMYKLLILVLALATPALSQWLSEYYLVKVSTNTERILL